MIRFALTANSPQNVSQHRPARRLAHPDQPVAPPPAPWPLTERVRQGTLALTALAAAGLCLAVVSGTRAVEISVRLDPQASSQPQSGRLFVFLSQQGQREPRFGPNWFRPEPFFAREVRAFAPGSIEVLDDRADGFPGPLSQLPSGTYRAQALLDFDFYEPSPAAGVGNLYSDVVELQIGSGEGADSCLVLEHAVEAEPFPEIAGVHEVVIESRLLSAFHGRPVVERASVILPPSYGQQPDRRYGVVYLIPGFGGSHRELRAFAFWTGAERQREVDAGRARRSDPNDAAENTAPSVLAADQGGADQTPDAAAGDPEVEFIYVALSGRCKWGHHVYADSATNGPRGRALIEEMIPAIDSRFRTIAEPTARFVAGHSSGGWASLWLQVQHPDTFGGVWSTSPDPVDFRDYQNVDLYADPPLSLYFDPAGNRRPIARRGQTPVLWYDSFGRMDDVLGRGGQLRSFEAVFSPLGADGQPRRLWDRTSGRIDPAVAKAWEAYDIRLHLERNWPRVGPKLAGKLHVVTGALDTFYLEGAVRLLGESLARLGSDAQIEIVPDKDHSNVLTAELRTRQRAEMRARFLSVHRP